MPFIIGWFSGNFRIDRNVAVPPSGNRRPVTPRYADGKNLHLSARFPLTAKRVTRHITPHCDRGRPANGNRLYPGESGRIRNLLGIGFSSARTRVRFNCDFAEIFSGFKDSKISYAYYPQCWERIAEKEFWRRAMTATNGGRIVDRDAM
jgi:hypothetical protein